MINLAELSKNDAPKHAMLFAHWILINGWNTLTLKKNAK